MTSSQKKNVLLTLIGVVALVLIGLSIRTSLMTTTVEVDDVVLVTTGTVPLFSEEAIVTSDSEYVQQLQQRFTQIDFNEELNILHARKAERTPEMTLLLHELNQDPLRMAWSVDDASVTVLDALEAENRTETIVLLRLAIARINEVMQIEQNEINLARPSQLDPTIVPTFEDGVGSSFPNAIAVRAYLIANIITLFDAERGRELARVADRVAQMTVITGGNFWVTILLSHEYAVRAVVQSAPKPEYQSMLQTIKNQEWVSVDSHSNP